MLPLFRNNWYCRIMNYDRLIGSLIGPLGSWLERVISSSTRTYCRLHTVGTYLCAYPFTMRTYYVVLRIYPTTWYLPVDSIPTWYLPGNENRIECPSIHSSSWFVRTSKFWLSLLFLYLVPHQVPPSRSLLGLYDTHSSLSRVSRQARQVG
jgi:hypothetical protein